MDGWVEALTSDVRCGVAAGEVGRWRPHQAEFCVVADSVQRSREVGTDGESLRSHRYQSTNERCC